MTERNDQDGTCQHCDRRADLAIRTTVPRDGGVRSTIFADLEDAPKTAVRYCASHGATLAAELALLSVGRPMVERSIQVGFDLKTWKPGERIRIPGRNGSYPDRSRDEYGHIVSVEEYLMVHSRVWVQMDGESEPRAINRDVLQHVKEDAEVKS